MTGLVLSGSGSAPVLSGTKQRALEMLAQGVPNGQVAQVLGVSDSAVSQLMQDEDFAKLVQEKRVQVSEQDEKFDGKLENGEERALDLILAKMNFGNLGQQLAVFKTLNQAKRRKDSRMVQPAGTGHTTTLVLPAVIVPVYVKNEQSEIIEVDGKTMLSANAQRLNEIVKERTGVEIAVQENKHLQAQKTLEAVTRSLVRPVRRQTRQVGTDLIDVL